MTNGSGRLHLRLSVLTEDAVATTETLGLPVVGLEERSRSLAMQNESLQRRIEVALGEMKGIITSNKALRAETTDSKITACGAMASQDDAQKVEANAASYRKIQAAGMTATARGPEIRERKEAKSKTIRQLGANVEEAVATPAEEQKASAVKSEGWDTPAGGLTGELDSSSEDVARLPSQLEEAVSMTQDLLVSRREIEADAAAARELEAELRSELEATQAAVRTLKLATRETVEHSEAALDDTENTLVAAQARLEKMKEERDAALRSLLEVVQARTTPVRPSQRQSVEEEQEEQREGEEVEDEEGGVVGDEGRHAHSHVVGYSRGYKSRTSFSRLFGSQGSIVYKKAGESQAEGFTPVPDEEISNISFCEINADNMNSFLRTSRGSASKSQGHISRASSADSLDLAAERRRNDDRRGTYRSGCGGGNGDYECRVHSTAVPTSSFRKLVGRLPSLDQARVKIGEARARAVEVEQEAAAAIRKMESVIAATHERAEQRLAAVETVAKMAATKLAEAQGLEKAGDTATAIVAAAQRKVVDLVGTAAAQEGEIAALRTRLRSAEEEVRAARREALLEGQAKALADVEAAQEKAAEVFDKAEALQDRCSHQEQVIADLASAREEEADACRAALESLANLRPALASSEKRAQDLEQEVSSLVSRLETANAQVAEKESSGAEGGSDETDFGRSRDKGGDHQASDCVEGGRSPPQSHGQNETDVYRYDDNGLSPKRVAKRKENDRGEAFDSRAVGGGASSRSVRGTDSRETKERGMERDLVLTLEESLHAARGETELLKRRVATLRAALREAQERGDKMEAAASSTRAVADASAAAAAAATAETNTAKAARQESEQSAVAAERRHHENVEALRTEVSRATAASFEAREELAVARGEESRLQQRLEESDRRMAILDRSLASVTSALHEAEAGRVRALVERVYCSGWEEHKMRPDDRFGGGVATGKRSGLAPVSASLDNSASCGDIPAEAKEGWCNSALGDTTGSSGDCGDYEVATLRDRLAASQVHHVQLVRASEEAMKRCNQRCEARVRTLLAAGKLAWACSRNRGLAAGRESTVEASSRLALLKRCFRALREEALSRSRGRSVRRQDRMQRWIMEAFEQAGGEIFGSRHFQKKKRTQHRWGEDTMEAEEGDGNPGDLVSSSSAGTTTRALLVGN